MHLETERLVIRDWRVDDAEAAFAIYGDPEVMRYVGRGQPYETVDQMREILQRIIDRDKGQPMGFWAAETKDGLLVGGALLKTLPDESDVEVGYHLGKQYWGRGFATELASALVQYGFERVGLGRIVGVTYPANIASGRVLEKAGLQHLGPSKYVDIDVELYSLDRKDWTRP